ncbi:MAG: tetratricopeptide repeat protein [Planctomycetes bacterium]|nr:tetratricopeptide repeat protein [Planctomycetota bacterium]
MATIEEALNVAVPYQEAGRIEEAASIYREILKAAPQCADALHLLGICLHQSGNTPLGIDHVRRAIRQRPEATTYHHNLSLIYLADESFDEAIASARRALQFDPDNAALHDNLGDCLLQGDRAEEAAGVFRRAVELCPELTKAHSNLSSAHFQLKEYQQACETAAHAVSLDPNYANAHLALGNAQQFLQQTDEAAASYRRALEIDPAFAKALNNLGNLLRFQAKLPEAEASYRLAIRSDPKYAEAYNNLALTLQEQGCVAEAAAAFNTALRFKPDYVDARWNLTLCRLIQGDFARGWNDYHLRFTREGQLLRRPPVPDWDGSALDGKTILVYGDQAAGDEIMFASCLGEVIAQCKRCVVECDPRIAPMLARSFPKARVVPREPSGELARICQAEAVDVSVALGTLPRFLRTDLRDFPRHDGYLQAAPVLVEVWKQRLPALGPGLKVGISWRGGGRPIDVSRRSTQLEAWDELLSLADVQFVNLQHGDCHDELQEAHKRLSVKLHDFNDVNRKGDLEQVAALAAALDLVISVQNTNVHLTAAQGQPIWVALPPVFEWRWMLKREDSPWYPSVRLFRQSQAGVWADVIERIEDALRALAGLAGGSG